MKLVLKNIARIEAADVEINGITVIAGENNTGKSTVGKSLYSVFNSLYHMENQAKKERVTTIANLIRRLVLQIRHEYIEVGRFDSKYVAEEIINKYYDEIDREEFIKSTIINLMDQKGISSKMNADEKKEIDDFVQRTKEVLDVSDEDILKRVITNNLADEFNNQINNIYCDGDGTIELVIRNQRVKIKISKNSVNKIENPVGLQTKAVYLDDPFVIDEAGTIEKYANFSSIFRKGADSSHRSDVREKLVYTGKENTAIDEILIDQKLEKIYEKIDSVCGGQMVSSKSIGLGYQEKGTDKVLDIKSISAGLKTFVILKTLLLNGTLEENGTIILDEPEIHLHPQWQLLFAELIVLIQKEFNMHILLNTHSPYFLQAIEVYAAKYEIADRCKYYLSYLKDNGAVIKDVSDSTESIYKLLARPFQDLENARYEND